MSQKERKQELQKAIGVFETHRDKLAGEAKNLDTKRAQHAENLEALKRKYSDACRAEALGQPNDREKLERDIATTSAKLAGTETLIAEKDAERKKLADDHAPVEEELKRIIAAENRERLLAEVEQHFRIGKDEVKGLISLRLTLTNRVELLRSPSYGADPVVRSAASHAAELLANASSGVRMHETFTAAELVELKNLEKDAV